MIEIFVFCTILFLPFFSLKVISKYKLIGSDEVINELYTYSKYLIFKIENSDELEKNRDFSKFIKYIKRNNKVFLVIHTTSKVIKAEKIDFFTEEKFNKSFNELKKSLKNKELKISIFNLKESNSDEKDFFWSLVNYRNFKFVKYITINNLTYFFALIITILLVLFNILNQKTLHSLGIPLQLSLVNLFDFGQFVLYDALCAMSSFLSIVTILLFFGLLIFTIVYFIKNRKDNQGNTSLFDHLLFGIFIATVGIIVFILILFMYFSLISIVKIDFPNSKIKYTNIFTTVGDYINYTGYPKIGNINEKSSYIVGYDANSIYFYNLEETNNKFFNFNKKEKNQILYDTCQLISEYKEDKNRLIIVLLKNKYLKAEYIKSILKRDAVITNERPLDSSDILIKDLDKKCQDYIENF